MKKSIRSQFARMADAALADCVITSVLKIPSLESTESRTVRVCEAMQANGAALRKKCTRTTRCGSLSCMVCRRRVQLSVLSIYAQDLTAFLTPKTKTKKGGA